MLIGERNKSNSIFKVSMFFVFLALVLFAGLRSSDIGTDTNNYVGSFQSYRVATTSVLDSKSSVEIGYLFIEKMCRNITDQYWFLLTIIASIVMFFSLKVFKKLSVNLWLSIFIFITLGFYLFFFNGARQGIAAAIYGMAIVQLVKGNFKKYVLWVLFAALFHKTVLITIPAYFLIKSKYSLKKIILAFVLSLGLISSWVYLITLFPGFLSEHYLAYDNRGALGGVLLTVCYFIMTVFFIRVRKFISANDRYLYDLFLNLTVFHTLIYLVILITGEDISMLRLAHYFSFGFVLIWPIIFRNLKVFNSLVPRIVFVLVHLVFYYVYVYKMSDLMPYQFNPELFN
jgi:hypothetical protein